MKLSILICSVYSRLRTNLPELLDRLHSQVDHRNDVEILVLYDNKKRSVGYKRNDLISMAQGEYLVFIDDDDLPAANYVQLILEEINKGASSDVIVFDTLTNMKDQNLVQHAKFGIEFDAWVQIGDKHRRDKPSHLNCWKSSLAKTVKYENYSFGEDTDWVNKMGEKAQSQSRIDKVLLYIYFERKLSETRTSKLRAPVLLKDYWRRSEKY